MSKIRLLLVLEAAVGGTRRQVADILKNLDLTRFEPHLAVSVLRDPGFKQYLDKLTEQGIKIHLLPMRRRISPLSDMLNLFRLFLLIKKYRFEVVHTHSSKAGCLGRCAARLAGVTHIIHTPHVFPFVMWSGKLRRWLYLRLEKQLAAFTDILVCVCRAERATALNAGIIHPDKIRLIENGIDPDYWCRPRDNNDGLRRRLRIGDRDLVVGMPARFMPQKGHSVLVQAAATVTREIPNIKFLLIGNGGLKNTITALVAGLHLEDYFIFLGRQEDLRPYYRLFDLMVIPSLWEALPYSLLEAMAMGTAVIAADTGGIKELIIHRNNGMICPVNQPDSLAKNIIELALDHELRSKCAEQAAKTIRESPQFHLAVMISRLEKLYAINNV